MNRTVYLNSDVDSRLERYKRYLETELGLRLSMSNTIKTILVRFLRDWEKSQENEDPVEVVA